MKGKLLLVVSPFFDAAFCPEHVLRQSASGSGNQKDANVGNTFYKSCKTLIKNPFFAQR
jgi:hypothetical protein